MASVMRGAQALRPLVASGMSASRRTATTGATPAVLRFMTARLASSASASSSSAAATATPTWDVRMLYDGECPLCMKEVNFLKGRDSGKGKIDFVDIASPSYTAQDNYGVSYETAMRKIHAIKSDGTIIVGVEVFRLLYEAVGLGFVYAAIKIEPIGRAAEALYNVWAKYRMETTGRENIEIVLSKRRATDSAMCSDASAACELPAAGSAASKESVASK
ncbi:hypothetical protein FOA52_001313 [Chlamydomonas sp. UWO 241]|nr:hypothetical protein FOA52_001313 [Chlamydomonas sp. UWO 241]